MLKNFKEKVVRNLFTLTSLEAKSLNRKWKVTKQTFLPEARFYFHVQ